MHEKPELEVVISQEVDALGLELVELRIGGSRGRPVLDVRIDRTDGAKVLVDDCARASRAIEARLDTMNHVLDGRYVLEVSSPGAERALRTMRDWKRFVGRRAVVKSEQLVPGGGRIEVEIVGVAGNSVGGAGREEQDADRVIVRDANGTEHMVPLAVIAEARLAFHWKP